MPPTFLFGLSLDGFAFLADLGVELSRVLHAGQEFTYHRLAHAGDTLVLRPVIAEVFTKKAGALEFVVREIAVSRDGRFVHASNRGDNDIAVFAVDGPGLRRIGNTPVGGNWPRHFALTPEETSLYVANQRSGTITRLSRDPDSGALSPSPDRYDCPSVAAITFHG